MTPRRRNHKSRAETHTHTNAHHIRAMHEKNGTDLAAASDKASGAFAHALDAETAILAFHLQKRTRVGMGAKVFSQTAPPRARRRDAPKTRGEREERREEGGSCANLVAGAISVGRRGERDDLLGRENAVALLLIARRAHRTDAADVAHDDEKSHHLEQDDEPDELSTHLLPNAINHIFHTRASSINHRGEEGGGDVMWRHKTKTQPNFGSLALALVLVDVRACVRACNRQGESRTGRTARSRAEAANGRRTRSWERRWGSHGVDDLVRAGAAAPP